ncbi:glycosyltransferase [Parerythrobacter jejuensis]|uniref:Glycosyltransferase n=1 Tax=Parerythrobacter jejuensis TaxID=795812 RepID=A0A845AZ22_9SPHN|nr:glycosyltransferase [Parerythrobacter jejuensis]MXP32008.1 glycosyltransferase [Parerythrobacter jejuensis]
MRRVLSLSTLYPNSAKPRFGTFVARSLEALAARADWDVTVINPIGIPPIPFGAYRELAQAAINGLENGVSVHRPTFPLIPKFGGRFNPALIARAVLPLARSLHAQQPFDVLDAQFFYPDGPAIARIAEELDLPFSIKARGADIHYWGATGFGNTAMRKASQEAAGLLSVCEALAQDMAVIGLPREKVSIHYTGLDRDRFRPLDHTGLRARLGEELRIAIADDEKLLVTVGALIPRKGQGLVIKAIADMPRTRLLLVGKGEDEDTLRSLANSAGDGLSDRVHFLGLLDHDLLPVVLSASDAMVLPSASEGLANAWVEALACGTPLVITNAGGAREVVTSRDAGLIVERDSDAIATGIKDLLADPPDRAATTAMAARFDWKVNGAALAEYYERLITK